MPLHLQPEPAHVFRVPAPSQDYYYPHLYTGSCPYCSSSTTDYTYTYGEDGCPASCGQRLDSIALSRFDDDYSYSVSSMPIATQRPFQYNYLLNLFTAPDMKAYLAQTSFTEDVYGLPLHLQRLISEAKEEVVLVQTTEQTSLALNRLELVRKYIWMQSDGDVASLIMALVQLVSDEDDLGHMLDQ